jgi:serine/threonine-protein kinase
MVGQNIGKYRVLDRVGRGGMGTVYQAIDETLHREVAIKVLNAELNDPEIAKRFRAEAITVARLNHPGIATIFELFQHEGQWLMVMEFVRGETLERMAERLGHLSPQRSAELCMQALAALAHAHSMGVVHRDLKPANLMITETGSVKIMDFGIARVTGTEHLTNAGFMMGTPAYMAPEQVMGHEIDARADLYALGVVYYRLVSGKLPFKGDTPFAMAQSQVSDPPTPIGTFRGDLPAWVDQLVVRSLAKSKEERFQSAVEFHEAFARCLAGLPMATLYSSSAPTELMTTPPRAMPTGTMQRPVSSATLPPLTAGPPVNVTPVATPAPPIVSGPPASQNDTPTISVMPPAASAASPAAANAASAATPPAIASADVPKPVNVPARSPEAPAPPQSKAAGAIAAAAVVLIVGAIAAWYFTRQPAAVPDSASTAAPSADAPPVAAPPSVLVPAESEKPPGVPPAAPPSSTPAAGRTTAAPPAAAAAAPGTSRSGAPAAARAGGAPASTSAAPTATAPPEAPMEYKQVRLLVINGRRSDDQEGMLSFSDGSMTIVGQGSGSGLASMPYDTLLRATYVHSRDPRWDPSLAGPPQDLDVGGIFRTAKHWLVLQGRETFMVLRLEDNNWRPILNTVVDRTKVQITLAKTQD